MFALLCLLAAPPADRFDAAREQMVRQYLEAEGIDDPAVLAAMRSTPRHLFMRPALRDQAYRDRALDIGYRQTISPPYIVAYMTQTLEVEPKHKVLEIGTGSGYQAAVLAPIAAEVYSIEIVPELARRAAATLRSLGHDNVTTKAGDGYLGWPEHAPFDRIIVTCSPEDIPQPLVDQLAEGGRMLIPLGQRYQQVFHLLEKRGGQLVQTELVPTLFVPMTGRSEQLRDIQPDGTRPELRNGSFEDLVDGAEDDPPRPVGWHYQRNLAVIDDAARGRRAIRLQPASHGEMAQCIQGLAVDGRRIDSLDLSLAARGETTTKSPAAPPNVMVTFYDSRRLVVGRGQVGPIATPGDDWKTFRRRLTVPRTTREAIVMVSMNGSTGTLDLDAIELTPNRR